MQRVLALEQTPSLSVPLRFFFAAPLFAVAAALLLFWHGPQALVSRWSPLTLALTHLLTLGFLTLVMIGALLQILPVVSGVGIPFVERNGKLLFVLMAAGTGALSGAFLQGAPALFQLALLLLLSGFFLLLVVMLRRLWQPHPGSDMLRAIRLAVAALAVVVALGATAASGFAWPLGLPLMAITDAHAAWGLGGWLLILVAGVAYQVVPMFQATPVYPALLSRWLAGLLFSLLIPWTVTAWPGPPLPAWPAMLSSTLAVACLAGFCGTTLYLLAQRRRPQPDATTWFWRTGLISGLGCCVAWFSGPLAGEARPLLAGILMIVGFGMSIICGMLYKIVPFLVWHHLQTSQTTARPPAMRLIISERSASVQHGLHVAALLLLLAAALWPHFPVLVRSAALMFALSAAALWRNLLTALRVYRCTLPVVP